MAGARGAHVGRSQRDRQEYINTTVKRNADPTIDDPQFAADSTDASELQSRTDVRRPATSRKRPSNSSWLRKHWAGVTISAALSLAAFILYQIYLLNREVGELTQQSGSLRESQQRNTTDLDRERQRIDHSLDRLSDRIDALGAGKTKK
jgi:hypothetical protein